jgi:hypothetical protein
VRQGAYQFWHCLLHAGPGCVAGNKSLTASAEATYSHARHQEASLTSDLRRARYHQAEATLPAAPAAQRRNRRRTCSAGPDRQSAARTNWIAVSVAGIDQPVQRELRSSGRTHLALPGLPGHLVPAGNGQIAAAAGLYEQIIAASAE